MIIDEILKTPIAVLFVIILVIAGVLCFIIAVIGRIPKLQFGNKVTASSLTVKGKKVYTLGGFGVLLILLAVYLVFSTPAQQARARQELIPTISAMETRIAEPTTTSMRNQVVVTQMVLVTPTPISTSMPDPFTIDTMDGLSNWTPAFCDEECGGSDATSAIFISSVPGITNNAIEIIYDLKNSGWALITKRVDPNADLKVLAKTTGISFMYKSVGAPNTIELKLLLRYPGDTEDTAFGAVWKANTTGRWTRVEARYDKDITCWWPVALCKQHGNLLELTALKRIDIAISNRLGDTEGLGKITFDDLIGITP